MRILHINKRYPPHVGGIEKHLQDLARAESRRPGVEVDVVCVAEGTPPGLWAGVREEGGRRDPGAADVYERDGRVAVRRVPQTALVASNPVSWGIARALLESRHDVWHFHYPFPTGELSLLLARRFRGAGAGGAAGRPPGFPAVVMSYHSDFVGEAGLKRFLSVPYARLTRAALEAADVVLAASPQLAARSRFLPAVSSKVRLVPYGIDTTALAPTAACLAGAAELRTRFGGPLALFVGRLVPYKGADVLLRALPAVPELRLVMVGDGPLRGELEALAAALGIAHRVAFVGALADEALAAHYRAADVFVLPSVTPNEAFGLVQLEAHACGLPVVSTNLPTGVPYVNRHEETGLVVEPGDISGLAAALNRLVCEADLRRRLGLCAQRRQRTDFSLEVMVDRVLDVYRGLLEGS
jgi:glycosyltransferase involved in cell wall biosynthesis